MDIPTVEDPPLNHKPKRYALFQGSDYYPLGGWFDLKGTYDNLEDAFIDATTESFSWWHVIDLHTGKLVRERKIS